MKIDFLKPEWKVNLFFLLARCHLHPSIILFQLKLQNFAHCENRWPNRIEWSIRNGQNRRSQQAKTMCSHTQITVWILFCFFNDDVQVFALFYCLVNVYVHKEISLCTFISNRKPNQYKHCEHIVWNCLFTSFYLPIHICPNQPIDTHVRHMCENNDQIVMNKRAIKVHITMLLKSNSIFSCTFCCLMSFLLLLVGLIVLGIFFVHMVPT